MRIDDFDVRFVVVFSFEWCGFSFLVVVVEVLIFGNKVSVRDGLILFF